MDSPFVPSNPARMTCYEFGAAQLGICVSGPRAFSIALIAESSA